MSECGQKLREKITIVTHSLPLENANGGPMTVSALIEHCRKNNYFVHIVVLRYVDDIAFEEVNIKEIREKVCRLSVIDVPVRSSGCKQYGILGNLVGLRDYDSVLRCDKLVLKEIQEYGPEVVIMYHWDSIASCRLVKKYFKVALLGDPLNAPSFRQAKYQIQESNKLCQPKALSKYFVYWIKNYRAGRVMGSLLRDCGKVISFQYQELRLYEKKYSGKIHYSPTPVNDSSDRDYWGSSETLLDTEKVTLLLGPSNLNSTVTSAGLAYFADNVLGGLLAYFGPNKMDIRIVGEGKLPVQLHYFLQSGWIKQIGRVDPPDQEFKNADIQISMTPFVLGNRVRLITGMMHSKCIVAHSSEAANIPELLHGHNCMLGRDGAELKRIIIFLIENKKERIRLGNNARMCYERYNFPPVACRKIMEMIYE